MVNGSAVGVATAAKTKISTTATRQPLISRLAGITPTALSPTRTTGKRNARPNARMKRVTKEKYIDACWMFDVPSGLNP